MSNKSKEQSAAEKDAADVHANQGGGTSGTAGNTGNGEGGASLAGKDEGAASNKDLVAKDNAAQRERGTPSKDDRAKRDAGNEVTIGEGKDARKITDRSGTVRFNRTSREDQIARADEAMERAADANSSGAQALKDREAEEEAKYADHDKLPPATGKAFDRSTPVIDDNGERHWTN